MSEIQWDYQLMTEEDSPEKKVGIFAIKNEVVNAALEYFEREELQVSYVQMAPMALYNYLVFDRPDLANSDKRASVIVNIGADSTDLVVCTASGVWQRCIMMGGNAFTQAISEAFKLSFEKAEKLKRTAPVSKYARQIFQAMRPVFTDWAGEVQRSLGFYTSSNPDVRLARVVAMGGGTKLRGLLKYLQQTLQIPVEKPDAFKRLAIAPGLSSAKFHESVSDFGTVYGLGLQGLGMARIESNLLPTSVARSMAWAGKTKYFIGAAVLLLAVSLMCLGRVGLDQVGYARNDATRSMTKRVVGEAESLIQTTDNFAGQEAEFQERMRTQFEYFKYRDIVPRLQEVLLSALPNAKNNPEQRALYDAFAAADVEKVTAIPRKDRRQLFITNLSMYYTDDLARAQFGKTALARKDAMMQMGMGGGDSYAEDEVMAQMLEIYGEQYMQEFGYGAGTEETKDPGFVVTVIGYSPYADYMDLIDPVGVERDPSRWGFVTRLQYLDEFLGGDSPFELYSKEAGHFRLDKGIVDLQQAPMGVGKLEFIEDPSIVDRSAVANNRMMGMMGYATAAGKQILVDPMTQEVISAEPMEDASGRPMLDAMGKPRLKVHDYWFAVDFKLVWRNAPVDAADSSTTTTQSPYAR